MSDPGSMISTACAVRSPKPGSAMQDVLKMMSSPPEAFTSLGPEKGFRDQVGFSNIGHSFATNFAAQHKLTDFSCLR